MDLTLTFVVAGLTLPIWLPLVLWYAADRDEKASIDANPSQIGVSQSKRKAKPFRHARTPRPATAWTGSAVPHSPHGDNAALEA